jgi:hypothetical protein
MRSFMYFTPHQTIHIIKSRRMGWVVHLACRGENKNALKILVGKYK